MRALVLGLTSLYIAATCVACSNQAILDPSQLSSFLDLRTINDTSATVTVLPCWEPACRNTKYMLSDDVRPGHYVDDADWNSVQSDGVAAVRISRASVLVGCLVIHFKKGEERATAYVSQTHPCQPGTPAEESVHPVEDLP